MTAQPSTTTIDQHFDTILWQESCTNEVTTGSDMEKPAMSVISDPKRNPKPQRPGSHSR